MESTSTFDLIVVGGGIAGISVVEQTTLEYPEVRILLLTSGSYVKIATPRLELTENIKELDVSEISVEDMKLKYPNLTIVSEVLAKVHTLRHQIEDISGTFYSYKKLCLCTGAVPKLVVGDNDHVIALRDTDSVVQLRDRLSSAKRICLVGNGGIASELVHEVRGVDVVWVVRDDYMASHFIDAGAAEFLADAVRGAESDGRAPPPPTPAPARTLRYAVADAGRGAGAGTHGCALGPNWHRSLHLAGSAADCRRTLRMEFEAEVTEVVSERPHNATEDGDWPAYVRLSNGKVLGCDLVVSAIGVRPNVPAGDVEWRLADDGGLLVDDVMAAAGVDDVHAAGDACTAGWPPAPHWFQMRLWTQARTTGLYAGRCLAAALRRRPRPTLDFSFELFTHVTHFFGFKVVLLGLFNGQRLGAGGYEALVRVTRGVEYVKLVVADGRVHGAVLVGETSLEETIENLILNQLDVSRHGEHLLDPDVDIDDYFD